MTTPTSTEASQATSAAPPARHRTGYRVGDPPSIVALATDGLRALILNGTLAPGERVVETRVAELLTVSRPPLREAMKVLENEGLIQSIPRRGAIVTPMTLHDVYEIITLRATLEEMAVRIGIPTPAAGRLDRLHEALALMEANAAAGTEATATEDSYRFHLALVALSGHRRLEDAYRSMALQLQMYLNLNRRARAGRESLTDRAARHRALYNSVVAGDVDAVLEELKGDASLSFVREFGATLPAGSPAAQAWLDGILASS
jgi:DNA-binding GntR family transcriptional regulator